MGVLILSNRIENITFGSSSPILVRANLFSCLKLQARFLAFKYILPFSMQVWLDQLFSGMFTITQPQSFVVA